MTQAFEERLPAPHPGLDPDDAARLEELTVHLLSRERGHPVLYKQLRSEIARRIDNQPDVSIRSTLAHMVKRGVVMDLGDGSYFLTRNLEHVERRICEVMRAHHAMFPYDAGMATGEIKRRFGRGKARNAKRNVDPRLFDRAMSACKERGLVVESEAGVRLSEFSPSSGQQEELRELEQAVLAYIGERRYSRIDQDEMARHLGVDMRKLQAIFLRLAKAKELVRYGEDRFMEASVMDEIRSTLAAELARKARLRTGEIKELLDIPRNAIIPLLESLDGVGFTRRDGEYRVLVDGADADRA
jgi:hypothetical protein